MHQLWCYDYEPKLNRVLVIHEYEGEFIKESMADQFLV